VTNNLIRRVWKHRAGLIRGFTSRYGMKRLVHFESFRRAEDAIRREKQVKDYARVKKLALIDSLNLEWRDLAEHWFANVQRADPSLRSG
jgi:putative endonuclease